MQIGFQLTVVTQHSQPNAPRYPARRRCASSPTTEVNYLNALREIKYYLLRYVRLELNIMKYSVFTMCKTVNTSAVGGDAQQRRAG